ncbi:MAG: hypothetical protein MI976_12665 [Pseudomonadales bacterium]|nr:hypothetical protein [Pseudomonadales bacterium]
MADIELAEAIRHLREQLSLAAKQSEDSDLKFEVGPIALELKVAATKAADAEAGVKWLVFNAGGSTNFKAESTQTLKLTLTPKTGDGNTFTVNDEGDERPE